MKYLIKDKGYNSYKLAKRTGVYSNDIGKCIHDQLPHYIDENGDFETEVIKSTNPEFKSILRKEMDQLERSIDHHKWRLREEEESLKNILQTLNELANEQHKEDVNVHA